MGLGVVIIKSDGGFKVVNCLLEIAQTGVRNAAAAECAGVVVVNLYGRAMICNGLLVVA